MAAKKPRKYNHKYKKKDFLIAIPGSGGFITTIAKRVGCARITVYDWMRKNPDLAQLIDDEKETLKDMAESELLRQIRDGNTTATIFFLKTQAKSRGYVERHEWTGGDGQPMKVVLTWGDDAPA